MPLQELRKKFFFVLEVNQMIRKPVISSNIFAIGYDTQTSILEIEFNNSRIYHYFAVSAQNHKQLMNASSHGKYLKQFIEPFHSYKKITK